MRLAMLHPGNPRRVKCLGAIQAHAPYRTGKGLWCGQTPDQAHREEMGLPPIRRCASPRFRQLAFRLNRQTSYDMDNGLEPIEPLKALTGDHIELRHTSRCT
jgi:hypothetical protein